MENQICPYYVKGYCRYGDKCRNYHPPNQQIAQQVPNINQNNLNSNKKNCIYFLKNGCTNKNCHYFHGFGDSLKHIKTIEKACDNEIINLVKMDDTKYITSDEQSFIIRFIQNDESLKETLNKNGFKIGKMIYGNNKAIFSLKKEGM